MATQNHSTVPPRLQAARAAHIQALRDDWDRIGLPHANLSDDQLHMLALRVLGMMHLLELDLNDDDSWQQVFQVIGARALAGGAA